MKFYMPSNITISKYDKILLTDVSELIFILRNNSKIHLLVRNHSQEATRAFKVLAGTQYTIF